MMSTAESVKAQLTALIGQANEATGKADADMTAAVTSLIEGFGQGGISELIDGSIAGEITDNTITNIRSGAFWGCSNITKISFPAVISIGERAFSNSGNTAFSDSVMDLSLPELTSIGAYAFFAAGIISSVSLPKLKDLTNYAFGNCPSLVHVDMPELETIGDNGFRSCSRLHSVNFPKAKSVGSTVFFDCKKLALVDFPLLTSVRDQVFRECKTLSTVILRTDTVCTLANVNAFVGTPIASGTGYIYVPRALLSDTDETKDYRRATNWSAYAAQFRALEDYTADGTITGELDPNKI